MNTKRVTETLTKAGLSSVANVTVGLALFVYIFVGKVGSLNDALLVAFGAWFGAILVVWAATFCLWSKNMSRSTR